MYRPVNRLNLSQTEIHELVTYDLEEGVLYTKHNDVISGNNITFHLYGKRYYISDICYVYYNGAIHEGKRVGFRDKDKHNIKASNLYLL